MRRFSSSSGRLRALLFLPLLVVPLLAAVASKTHYYEVADEGQRALVAHLDLALGSVRVGRAEEGYLFQAQVNLETDQLRPSFDYTEDAGTGHLSVDLETKKDGSKKFPSLSAAKNSEWLLLFGDQAPLDLQIELGAASAEFDFTDLPVSHLRLDTGASSSTIAFNAPNPVEMETLSISAGASALRIEGLGHARAKYIQFEGGVGKYNLDFSGGTLAQAGRADITIGMAALTVVLPDDRPVIVTAPDNWLCSVEVPNGFTKQSKGVWSSEKSIDSGTEAYTVAVEAGMGKVNFVYR